MSGSRASRRRVPRRSAAPSSISNRARSSRAGEGSSTATDSRAIIRFDETRGTYLQHYFGSRGVARVYEMTFSAGVWTLSRTTADLSALEFSQRFTGTLDADRNTITGQWEISREGSRWEHDFDLVYTRMPQQALLEHDRATAGGRRYRAAQA